MRGYCGTSGVGRRGENEAFEFVSVVSSLKLRDGWLVICLSGDVKGDD